MHSKSFRTVAMTVTLAATLGVGVLSAAVASADDNTEPTAGASPTSTAPGGEHRFRDEDGSIFKTDIDWAESAGISTGYQDGTFRPTLLVTREAMAAFMYRLAGSPAFTPPSVSPFSDVATTDQFYKEITWLASTKITTGYSDGTFRPLNPVARDAMAAFMYRFVTGFCPTAPGVEGFEPGDSGEFGDEQPGDAFYKEIAWIKSVHVSTGYQDGTYRPGDEVSREAMAAFLHRLENFFESHGCTTSPSPTPSPTDTAAPTATATATPLPTGTATPTP